MSHYSQPAYAVPAAPYPGHPPPALEIPAPPPPPPHAPTVQPAYHHYSSGHPYVANNAAYPPLPLSHQYPPGYAPPPAYASPPSAPPALYPDSRLAAYPAPAVPPPPMSPYPPNPPVVVYANGQSSSTPIPSQQQGYYSSMLNSPLPSPHQMTSPTRSYSLPNQASQRQIPSPQHNGLKSPISSTTSKSPVAAMKSPGAFLPPRSPGHSKSPVHAPMSPVKSSEPKKSERQNGPLQSLEKMILHEKSESSEQECKVNLISDSNPPRSDSCRRRSSSHSGDDRGLSEPIRPGADNDHTDSVTPGKKKRGRPTGSRTRKRTNDEDITKRKRAKKIDAKTAIALSKKPEKSDKIGPRIRVEGRISPKTCTVINNVSHSEDKANKSSEKERVKMAEVKLTDAPWVCCFCGWGSTHSNLGDLFGPYQVEGLRPPRRESPKRRKRRDSRCSDDGDRKLEVGEVWVHEDCATWAEGVYMVGYRIQGLDEAARIARQMQCTACKVDGATIGCLHKGCQQKYHYPCAINKDCLLNEENFSLVCHKHKDKKIKLADHRLASH